MKLNQFRNVIAIAESGSLRAAARQLGLAQPALSRSVQELEHELGVQLFERRARGMALTPVGEAFFRRAGNVMTEVRRVREEIDQLNGATSGSVVAALSIAPHLAMLPKLLPQFRRRYPDVELRLIEGLYPTVEAGLKDGSIDFYVGPSPERKVLPDLAVEKLFDNTRAILCRKGHSLAGARSVHDLVGAHWLTTSITHDAQEELSDFFGRYRLPTPHIALRSQSALTAIVSLANSDLLAMVPMQWVAFPLTADTLVSIDIAEPLPTRPITIIKRAGFPLTPAAEYMVDLVRGYQSQDKTPTRQRPQRQTRAAGRRV